MSHFHFVTFQFARVLARFRPESAPGQSQSAALARNKKKAQHLNTKEEKLKFAFKMYDMNDDDKIAQKEVIMI